MKIKIIIAAALIFLFAVSARASTVTQDIYSSTGIIFPLLDMGVGARAIAMGGAATAVVSDPSAIYWNPAGLSNIKDLSASLEYKKWFMDALIANVMGVMPMKSGSLGLGLTFAGMGFFQQKDLDGFLTGVEYYPYAFVLSAGYGINLFEGLSIGIAAKGAAQNVAEIWRGALAFDFGLDYAAADTFFAGVCAQNLKALSDYPSPAGVKAGLAGKFKISEDHKIMLAADAAFKIDSDTEYSFGAEYTAYKLFSARGGYIVRQNAGGDYGGMSGLRFGVGIKTGIFNIDYAAMFFGDMGLNHIITLELNYKEGDRAAVQKLSTTEYEALLAKRYMSDAMVYYNLDHFREALSFLSKANTLTPGNQSVKKWYAHISGLIKKAATAKLPPDQPQMDKAARLYTENKYSEALGVLKLIEAGSANYSKAQAIIKTINSRMAEIEIDVEEAGVLAKKGDLLSAVRKLKTARSMCPGCEAPLKAYRSFVQEVAVKAKEYYLKGVENYTGGNLQDSIKYWEYVIELAPESGYADNAKKNIEKARDKAKAIKQLE